MKQCFVRVVLLLLLILVFAVPAFPQDTSATQGTSEEKNEEKKFSGSCSGGFHVIPGSLLSRGLHEHPNRLTGPAAGCSTEYRPEKRMENWFFLLDATLISAEGKGRWAREDTEEQFTANGVQEGSVTGTATVRIWTFSGCMGKRFPFGRVQPYGQGCIGGGILKASFGGTFRGTILRQGREIPIERPVHDLVRRIIPVFAGEAGIEVKITRRCKFTGGPYWNTGYGGKLNITCAIF